jgi:hypothetical protein
MIAFEHQGPEDIEHHMQELLKIDPDRATFYILTPIPGTEQYDDFMARGLITAKSLNELTSVGLTWNHPKITPAQATKLMFDCYRTFYATGRYLKTLRRSWRKTRRFSDLSVRLMSTVLWLETRASVALGIHPHNGGFLPWRVDHADEYRALRRERFDCDEVPLPASRPVPASELVPLRPTENDVYSEIVSLPSRGSAAAVAQGASNVA